MKPADMYIDASAVSQRKKAEGISLSYIEGHRVTQTLNEIYPDSWNFEITQLEHLTSRTLEKTNATTGEVKTGWEIGYRCIGKLTLYGHVTRTFEDVGFGSGTSYNSQYDSHESAGKEAVTDCMKRCARNLGNVFGLALYDKAQEAVLSHDAAGWNKLRNQATQYTSLEVQKQIDAIKDRVKDKYNVSLPADMKPYMWKEILTEAWAIYWDSFIQKPQETQDALTQIPA